VKAIVSHLLEQDVFTYSPGRDMATDVHLRAIPATDLYGAGADAIANGDAVSRYIATKLAHRAGESGGLDPEHGPSGDVGEGSDGLFSSREPTWSFEEGTEGANSEGFSVWD
jgi:hypothetical protein